MRFRSLNLGACRAKLWLGSVASARKVKVGGDFLLWDQPLRLPGKAARGLAGPAGFCWGGGNPRLSLGFPPALSARLLSQALERRKREAKLLTEEKKNLHQTKGKQRVCFFVILARKKGAFHHLESRNRLEKQPVFPRRRWDLVLRRSIWGPKKAVRDLLANRRNGRVILEGGPRELRPLLFWNGDRPRRLLKTVVEP